MFSRSIPSRKRLALVTLTSLALGLAGLKGGQWYIQNVVPLQAMRGRSADPWTVIHDSGKHAFPDGVDRLNILVLGIDNNYDRKGMPYTKGARSDTMMVVSVSRDAKFLNVVSIPRDTQVLISQRFGSEKINAAYAFGGADQAVQTVSSFLKVPIHHYLVVKIAGAKKVVDALGGLPIDVEKDMDYDDNWGHLHVHLKKGRQTLSGEQAIGYARFRKDEEGDRGRMRRQQQVIRAMVELLKSGKLATRLGPTAQAVKAALETDLLTPEMFDLAMIYRNFDRKKLRSAQIEGYDEMVNGVAVILPDDAKNEKMIRALLRGEGKLPAPAPERSPLPAAPVSEPPRPAPRRPRSDTPPEPPVRSQTIEPTPEAARSPLQPDQPSPEPMATPARPEPPRAPEPQPPARPAPPPEPVRSAEPPRPQPVQIPPPQPRPVEVPPPEPVATPVMGGN